MKFIITIIILTSIYISTYAQSLDVDGSIRTLDSNGAPIGFINKTNDGNYLIQTNEDDMILRSLFGDFSIEAGMGGQLNLETIIKIRDGDIFFPNMQAPQRSSKPGELLLIDGNRRLGKYDVSENVIFNEVSAPVILDKRGRLGVQNREFVELNKARDLSFEDLENNISGYHTYFKNKVLLDSITVIGDTQSSQDTITIEFQRLHRFIKRTNYLTFAIAKVSNFGDLSFFERRTVKIEPTGINPSPQVDLDNYQYRIIITNPQYLQSALISFLMGQGISSGA